MPRVLDERSDFIGTVAGAAGVTDGQEDAPDRGPKLFFLGRCHPMRT